MADTVAQDIVELAGLQQDWRNKLITTDKGVPITGVANAIAALRYAPGWTGVLGFDEFNFRTEAVAPPPWAAGDNNWTPRAWDAGR